MKQIEKTKHCSYKIGPLANGCSQCIKGSKSVLFITGICSNNCFFCPISDQKKNKDVIFINEWKTNDFKDIIKEIKLCDSKGVGITGGDPLSRIERTCNFIKKLKKQFGQKFHIHLYTPLVLVNKTNLKKLYNAGLDEIRFHPDLENNKLWENIEYAKTFDWDIGVEIPIIPGKEKETKTLIDFISDKIKFLNLNELEISDTNANKLVEQGYKTKDKISYGVKGSEMLAKKLLKYCQKYKFNVHYCTCTLKDRIQLANRIKKRAKNTARKYDFVDDEGMLNKGLIFGNLSKAKKLLKDYNVPNFLYEIDKERNRLLTSIEVVVKLKDILKENKLKPAIVKEYPTHDRMILEQEFL